MNAPVLTYRLLPEPPVAFADLDLVRVLTDAKTDEGEVVPSGTRGTIVGMYAEGAAYEVEFEAGLATVKAGDLVAA